MSEKDEGRENETFNDFSFFCYSEKNTDYDFAGRNFLRLLCWEMDILKRLPWELEHKVFGESYPLY